MQTRLSEAVRPRGTTGMEQLDGSVFGLASGAGKCGSEDGGFVVRNVSGAAIFVR